MQGTRKYLVQKYPLQMPNTAKSVSYQTEPKLLWAHKLEKSSCRIPSMALPHT